MKAFRAVGALVFLFMSAPLVGCGPDGAPGGADSTAQGEVRSITREEALADFDQMVSNIRALYGPLERKEQRYGFDFDATAKRFRNRVARAKSEANFFAVYKEFLAQLKDAHVSLDAPFMSDETRTFQLPFFAMPVEDTYVVYRVFGDIGLERGDEVLSLNGTSARVLVTDLLRYVGEPSERSAKHMAALYLTYRPGFLSQKLTAGAEVKVRVRKASGELKTVTVKWASDSALLPPREPVAVPTADDLNSSSAMYVSESVAQVVHAELTAYGAGLPFFLSPQVKAEFGLSEPITPSPAALAKFGLTPEQVARANFFAATYERAGKKILLLRIPSYTPALGTQVSLSYLRALLDEQQPLVDALVLDETHNPGGSVDFALGLISLLTPRQVNGLVQRMNADRLWIGKFASLADRIRNLGPDQVDAVEKETWVKELEERARLVDDAYSSNQSLSSPLPLGLWERTLEPDAVHWSKPLLVLADELSVSCADFVPLIIKGNGLGKVFGQRTMGGGGNVEELSALPNTQAKLNLTRGLGTLYDPTGAYPEALFIEDNGVTPDILYTHTLVDFRAGYVAYANAFTDEVLKLTPPAAAAN